MIHNTKTQHKSRASIFQIPIDVLQYLGSFLSSKDEISMLSTCKEFSCEMKKRANDYFNSRLSNLSNKIYAWDPTDNARIDVTVSVPDGNFLIMLGLDMRPLRNLYTFGDKLTAFATQNGVQQKVL